MLNLQEIAQCIDNPELVYEKEVNTFGELSEKYPYTQLYSLLYLKGLKDSNDVHFDDALLEHSFRITDRVRLYDLIKEKHEPSINPTPEEHSSESEEQPSVDLKVIPAETSESNTAETTDQDSEEETIIDTPEVDVEESAISDDKLEREILHHAVTANYELPDLTDNELAELEERVKIEEDVVEEGQREEVDFNTKLSFTSWIKSNSNYSEEVDLDKQAINAVVNSFSEFDPSEKLFGEIERPKKEFFSPSKKAKESLKEDELPVSETLAKIYAAQGNYPKAIHAYEQLILKNPEKKSFFANLIKDLKKKIKER